MLTNPYFWMLVVGCLTILVLGTVSTTRASKSYHLNAQDKMPRTWSMNGAFSTTDTSGTIVVPAFIAAGKIVSVTMSYIGTVAAADGPLACTNTITNGYYVVGAGNTLTIARVAGTTSAAKFTVHVFAE